MMILHTHTLMYASIRPFKESLIFILFFFRFYDCAYSVINCQSMKHVPAKNIIKLLMKLHGFAINLRNNNVCFLRTLFILF